MDREIVRQFKSPQRASKSYQPTAKNKYVRLLHFVFFGNALDEASVIMSLNCILYMISKKKCILVICMFIAHRYFFTEHIYLRYYLSLYVCYFIYFSHMENLLIDEFRVQKILEDSRLEAHLKSYIPMLIFKPNLGGSQLRSVQYQSAILIFVP